MLYCYFAPHVFCFRICVCFVSSFFQRSLEVFLPLFILSVRLFVNSPSYFLFYSCFSYFVLSVPKNFCCSLNFCFIFRCTWLLVCFAFFTLLQEVSVGVKFIIGFSFDFHNFSTFHLKRYCILLLSHTFSCLFRRSKTTLPLLFIVALLSFLFILGILSAALF